MTVRSVASTADLLLLSERVCHSLGISLVSLNLDYCNSLQMNVLTSQLSRLVSRTPQYQCITPVGKDLRWLPVVACIEYKILCTYLSANSSSRDSRLRQGHSLQIAVLPVTRAICRRAFGNSQPKK